VYVARGFDGCLAFYTKEEWDPFCAKLLSLPSNKKEVRKAIRFTISSACECEFDKLGRINIPTNLRTLAHLEKECVIIGAGNHGEIWSQEKWNQYYNDNQDSYDDILESLDDFSL
ncbi:division/cell wall cluster transcriptional repressor MraZ, partial [Faecalibacillus intestinalis]